MTFGFSKGLELSMLKIMEIPGERGFIKDLLEWKFLGVGGCKPKNPPLGGDGYFTFWFGLFFHPLLAVAVITCMIDWQQQKAQLVGF